MSNAAEEKILEKFVYPNHDAGVSDLNITHPDTHNPNGPVTLNYTLHINTREIRCETTVARTEWSEAQIEWARRDAVDPPSDEFVRGAREAIEAFAAYFCDEDENVIVEGLSAADLDSHQQGALLDALRDHRAEL